MLMVAKNGSDCQSWPPYVTGVFYIKSDISIGERPGIAWLDVHLKDVQPD